MPGGCADLTDTPEAYAAFDWKLHHRLTAASGNAIYTLILNGFAGFTSRCGALFECRKRVLHPAPLQGAAQGRAAEDAAKRAHRAPVMDKSIALWNKTYDEGRK